jgi:hypothetical protein
MPAEAKDCIHALAWGAKAHRGLTFAGSDGNDLDALCPEEADDANSDCDPDEDDASTDSADASDDYDASTDSADASNDEASHASSDSSKTMTMMIMIPTSRPCQPLSLQDEWMPMTPATTTRP